MLESPRFFRLFFVAVSLLFVLSGCAEPPYASIDNATLQTLIAKKIPLYDIRRPEEWQQTGILQGSHPLTFVDGQGAIAPGFFDRFLARQKKEEPVILICRTGNRSAYLASVLAEQYGFTQVYNVKRGIMDWIGADLPVVKPPVGE